MGLTFQHLLSSFHGESETPSQRLHRLCYEPRRYWTRRDRQIYRSKEHEWDEAEDNAYLRRRDSWATEYRYPGRRPWQARMGRTWYERVRDGVEVRGEGRDKDRGKVWEWLQY